MGGRGGGAGEGDGGGSDGEGVTWGGGGDGGGEEGDGGGGDGGAGGSIGGPSIQCAPPQRGTLFVPKSSTAKAIEYLAAELKAAPEPSFRHGRLSTLDVPLAPFRAICSVSMAQNCVLLSFSQGDQRSQLASPSVKAGGCLSLSMKSMVGQRAPSAAGTTARTPCTLGRPVGRSEAALGIHQLQPKLPPAPVPLAVAAPHMGSVGLYGRPAASWGEKGEKGTAAGGKMPAAVGSPMEAT